MTEITDTETGITYTLMRRCPVCGETKDPAAFQSKRAECSTCRAKRDRERKYGITPTEFDALVEAQGGRCACCGKSLGDEPCLDHDHATGAVRGVLCSPCNSGIGFLGDTPQALLRALRYLLGDFETREDNHQ